MIDPFAAPVVYVGSTLSAEEVRHLLPGALIRKPARRFDLYRDRAFGASTFVLIDGVFFQRLAISPREVLDLLADGARVIGAASMGALRAAECWPRGMVGKGLIYRLFRRGWLDSDDEVAVSFQTESPAHGTVALVNVRYAARAAARAGLLSPEQGERLVAAARALFFAERHWPRILADAGLPRGLAPELARYDLKRADAVRCLKYVARLAPLPSAARVLVPRDHTRERSLDVESLATPGSREKLAEWLLLTGRYRRALATTRPSPRRLFQDPISRPRQRALWSALEERGELLPELLRYRAFDEACRRTKPRAAPSAVAAVRSSLAVSHGYADWAQLMSRLGPEGRRRLLAFSTRLAAARGLTPT